MGDNPVEQSSEKNSVEKALTILMAFIPYNRWMGSSELSRMLGFTNSTVNRLLHILESLEFVKQDPVSKKFCLGKTSFYMGRAVSASLSNELVNIARPYCDKLRDAVGETVGLELWSGDSTIQAYNAPSLSPISVLNTLGRLGEKYPNHVSAGAKAILAFSPPELVDQVIKGELERFTPNTITDPKEFKKHLLEVRERGVAIDNGEFNIEVYAVSAPVFGAFNKPVAAVVIAAPFYRATALLNPATLAKLNETVSEISAQLFYSKDNEKK